MAAMLNGTQVYYQLATSSSTNTMFTPGSLVGITPGYTNAMPQFLNPPYMGGIGDPLGYGVQQAPRPETPEQWLRRRVRETCWKPA